VGTEASSKAQNLGALKARLSSLAAARGGGGSSAAVAGTPGGAGPAAPTTSAPLSARPPPAIGRATAIFAPAAPSLASPPPGAPLPADAAAASAEATAAAAAAVSLADLAARTVLNGELAGACEAALASSSARELRACLLASRARGAALADAAARFEREVEGRVEAAALASKAAARDARADAARAEHGAAVAAVAAKAAAAAAAVDLDAARCDAARGAREVERLTGERDAAREAARVAEEAAATATAAEWAARKDAARAGREADGARADAEAAASGARAAAAAAEAAAQAERAAVAERLAAVDGRVAAAEAEAGRLRADLEAARGEVEDGRAAVDAAGQAAAEAGAKAAAAEAAAAEADARAAAADAHAHAARAAVAAADERAAAAAADAEAARAAAADADGRAAGAADLVAAADARAAAAEAKAASAVAGTADADARIGAATARAEAAEGALRAAREGEAAASRRAAANDALAAGAAAEVEGARAETRAAITARDAAVATSTDATQKLARVEGELAALQDAIGGALGAEEDAGIDQAGMVRRLVERVGGLEAALGEAATERRRLHNALVELKGNIRVFCRIRPGAPADGPPVVAPAPDGLAVKLVAGSGTAGSSAGAPAKPHAFAFDRAFGPGASQAAVFEEVADLVQSALDGYAVCLFSYGQTGAGKTWTMTGGPGPDAAGIIPRAVAKVLDAARRAGPGGWAYTFEASFVEVYNEGLRDLLHPEAPKGGGRLGDPNAIQHTADGHTRVVGATRVPVATGADIESLLATSAAARSTAATAMNDTSSRSHSVFMLAIAGAHEGAGVALKGALNLVDLAGSERLGRSLAEGDRAREACAINKSLSALGDVFAALAAKAPHIPYRNSKLTHLLQPCLGGSGKTLMFVNVAPDEASSGETLCSLRFAAKVNGVETAAKGGAKRAVGKIESVGASGAGVSGAAGAGVKRRAVGAAAAPKK